jgi:hypothetical protein
MQNNIIDINNMKSYPIDFLNFINLKKEILLNTFKNKEVSIDVDTYLYEYIGQIFNNKFFECMHATRIINIDNIIKNGLIIPSLLSNFSEVILNPIKEIVDNEMYSQCCIIMNNIIKNNAKYSRLHFVFGDSNDISLENGFLMLENYGGELLYDVFFYLGKKEYYNLSIKNLGESYVVHFKINKEKLSNHVLAEIYSQMIKNCLYGYSHYFRETYVEENINSNNIMYETKIKDGDVNE